ncbi:MAG: SusD/RagB family nutrient-binding outer membrane lipoprotein [Williamsia sp.]|nr:SusD/RagB family nutrient-binding outer membrane lipoprotein [Williamsia sp.]
MNKKVFFSLIVGFLVVLTSCKKAVEGYNNDPNNPLDADAITMLTGIEVGNMEIQEGELARIAGMWSGYFTGEQFQYQSFYQYLIIARNFDDSWQRIFAGTLKNERMMKRKAYGVNNRRLVGLAQAIEANVIGTATALWGDIPFKQASNDSFPNPQYDPQASVYAAVQSLLDSAIQNFASTAFIDFAAQDIYFGGNMTKWTQAAYTLKARYYMHTRQYAQALAAAQNGINTAANNWVAPHSSAGTGTYNLYYQFMAQVRPGFMDANGAYAVALLNAANARYRGNAKTIEKSRYNYLYSTATNPNYTANGFFYQTVAFPIASYAENLLILAEAEARTSGFTAGLTRLNTYRAYLATGGYIGSSYLTAGSYKYDPYVAADFASGGIENPTASAIAQDRALLREIMEERYLTFTGQIEGFNDLRRVFKEPDIRVPVTANTGSQFPQRFLYAQVEVDLNKSTPNPIPSLFTPTAVNN